MDAINPATDETFAHYDEMSPVQTKAAIDAAHAAHLAWRKTDFEHRAALLRKAGALLRERKREYGTLMAKEMGKPIKDGIAEAEKCALGCDYYADNAAKFLADEIVEQGEKKSFVAFRPLGVILAVMPWNFPFWQVVRFAAPALMAGNAGVLKHSANVPGCAMALEKLFRDAGFPEHLFRTLLISSKAVDGVIEHPLIRAVSLTGSGPAGRAVASKAGSLLKKTVLELGGADAYLILQKSDIAFTASSCAKGRLVNSGQSCIAAKRFIVVRELAEDFEKTFVIEMNKAVVGDPLDENTTVGPMARRDLRDDLHKQVTDSLAKGARLLSGGKIPSGPGAFYPPTVLTDLKPGMPAYDEELFGPVASVIVAKDKDEAVRIANESPFGLGGGVFTPDLALGERIAADEIDAGLVFVNGAVASAPNLPFGGVKESGYGRELSSFGIREFVNIKTVVVAPHGSGAVTKHHIE
jgi:succinate-semialdehyde dehydrogenase/glutarate-semialdehyde dehydrogenase